MVKRLNLRHINLKTKIFDEYFVNCKTRKNEEEKVKAEIDYV